MYRSSRRTSRARNIHSVRSLLLFLVIAGCATKPLPISSQVLEGGDDWNVTETVYSQADIQALPVYTLPADEQKGDAVERAVAWCEADRTPCCYQTQDGETPACYQLVGRGKAAKALIHRLRELIKQRKKDVSQPSKEAKPLQPGLPPGFKSNRELGEFLKWPTPQNPRGGPLPSADQLRQRGITREDIQRWQEFYGKVDMHHPDNPSATSRARYLEQLKRLLD